MLNIGSFKPLSELCSIISSGGTPSRKMPHYFDKNGHLWVKSKELLFKGIDDTEEKISDEGLKKSSAKYYPSGTILVAMYGANVGQLAWLKKPATVNQAICALVVDEQKADNMFVYYSLLHTREKLIVQAQGAAQQNLNAGQIKSFEIPYIDLENQQKIASILSAYDDLIENNNRRITILEEMARNLYREWFVKFRFPGHEEVKMVDSELGQIPEGWEVVKLSDIASVNPESIGNATAPKNILYIDISSVGTGKVESIQELSFLDAPSRARRIVKNGDIIWATVRPNRKQYAYMVHPTENTIVSTGFAVLRAKKVPSVYLYEAVTTDNYVNYLINNVSGAAYPAVNSQDFNNSVILKPSNSILSLYEMKVLSIRLLINNLLKKNQNLKTQRDMLLPKLISGKIIVK